MKTLSRILAGISVAAALTAQTPAPIQPTKVGVIDLQAAIVETNDGKKAATDLKTKFSPKQGELEKKQQDIAALQTQLRNGQNTMSEENKQKLMREIDQKNTGLKRDTEDVTADVEQEQQRLMGELIPKIISVLNKYATENGFAIVLDLSGQQTPVLFASNTVNITKDIVDLYNKTSSFAPPPAAVPKKPGNN